MANQDSGFRKRKSCDLEGTVVILGISCFYHDAAAALLRDGDLVAAAEEERFNRRKHYDGFPALAVEYCLREAGITIDGVDHVVFYEKPLTKFGRIVETVLAEWPRSYGLWMRGVPMWVTTKLDHRALFRRALGTDKPILFCGHHASHAASAFLASEFDEAAILTADGVGEWTTTAWGAGRDTSVALTHEIRFPHSIGLLFSALTAYLGFRVNDAEWKVMGLAPYGRPRYFEQLRRLVDLRPDGSFRLDLRYFSYCYSTRRMFNRRWEDLFGQPARRPEAELTEFHADMARSGQQLVEEMLLGIARHMRTETGLRDICIAGGVGLNSVANWRIFREAGFDRIFVQPAAGDSGGALGAALYVHNTVLKQPRRFVMRHACYGPSFDADQIAAVLTRQGAAFRVVNVEEDLLRETAAWIAEGKVVGWFQGRMEFGPRALGSRSLLADPRNPRMKEIINAKVKFREAFRPFAPSVLKECATEYFDMPAGLDAPFMLLVPPVRPDKRAVIPAVTHEDGSGRVQTITEEQNGRYYRLVRAFGDLTGVPVVLNTSFNVRGEPIVCSPEDAYRTFVNTGIDVLVLGNYVVTQKTAAVDFDAGRRRSEHLEQDRLI
ncbi:MAG: carbamoyltransferase [Bacteroidales bacterium]